MQIMITQLDSTIPLAWVELDLTQYNYRNRRYHGDIPVHDDAEWKFRLDRFLAERGFERIVPWGEVRNSPRFCHYKKSIVGYRTCVRLDR